MKTRPRDRPGGFNLTPQKMNQEHLLPERIQIRLQWWESDEDGIHYAHHRGRTIVLRGFPHPTKWAREFEVHDGRGRVGLIHGLAAAKRYAERHLEKILI